MTGLTKYFGSFIPSSLFHEISMTITLRGTPTCTAASPMPGASYIVSSMSSMSLRISSSTFSTGFEIVFKRGSGAVKIFLIAIIMR